MVCKQSRHPPQAPPGLEQRVPQPLENRLTCPHHGILDDSKLWFERRLQPDEIENDGGMWDTDKVTGALRYLISTWGLEFQAFDTPTVWSAIGQTGLFWTGKPYNRGSARLWVKGWCSGTKVARVVQFGRLKCGCCTPRVSPFAELKLAIYGDGTGKDAIIYIITRLFGDC